MLDRYVDSNDAIVIAGGENGSTDAFQGFVARFTSTGAVDTSFGSNGVVILPWQSANALSLGSDGSITVIGGTTSDIAVARLTTSGALDTSFGPSGTGFAYGGLSRAFGTAGYAQPDGKIVVAGGIAPTGQPFCLIARFNADGDALDYAFGLDGGSAQLGYQTVPLTASGGEDCAPVAVVPLAGGIALAANSGVEPSSTRFPAAALLDATDGTLVPSFGDGGVAVFAIPGGEFNAAVAQQGQLLAAGDTGFSNSNAIIDLQLTSQGLLDTSFGSGGVVETGFSSYPDSQSGPSAHAVAIDSSGRIVTAGSAYDSMKREAAIVRMNPDGTYDTTFAGPTYQGGGVVRLPITSASDENQYDQINGVAFQSDGSIILADFTQNPDGSTAWLARLHP